MKYLFLNQMAGPLFMELAEDISLAVGDCTLLTGHPDALQRPNVQGLKKIRAVMYERKTVFSRVLSWCRYFFTALMLALRSEREAVLFMVSNPPFLGAVGIISKILRKHKYCVLIYDIYPDIAVGMSVMKNGLLAKMWKSYNRVLFSNATHLFTIGEDMKEKLTAYTSKKINVIPCWADTNIIQPVKRKENKFALQHGLSPEKTVVLYSGNMGHSHNILELAAVAKLCTTEGVAFVFIGEGAQRKAVEEVARQKNNVLLLPYQPEAMLRYSLTSGDIGVASYQTGTEGCMVPSKAYYYLAAGLCLFVLSEKENDLTGLVRKFECGFWSKPGNPSEMVTLFTSLHDDKAMLQKMKSNARRAAEIHFSKANTQKFIEVLDA